MAPRRAVQRGCWRHGAQFGPSEHRSSRGEPGSFHRSPPSWKERSFLHGEKQIQPLLCKGHKLIGIAVVEADWKTQKVLPGLAVHAQDIGPSGPFSPSPAAASFLCQKGCTPCPGMLCGLGMQCWSTFGHKDAVPSTLGVPTPARKNSDLRQAVFPFEREGCAGNSAGA